MVRMDFTFIINRNSRGRILAMFSMAAFLSCATLAEASVDERARLRRMLAATEALDHLQARITEEESALREIAQQEALVYAASRGADGAEAQTVQTEEQSRPEGLLNRFGFGRAQLRTSVVTELKYDDNVYQFPDNEKSDMVPRLNYAYYLRLPRGQSYLEANYAHNYRHFPNRTTSEREQTFRVTSLYRPSDIFNWELTHEYVRTSDLGVFDTNFSEQSISNKRKRRKDRNATTSILTYMPGGRHNLLHLRMQHEDISAAVQEYESQTERIDFDFERYFDPTTSLLMGFSYRLFDERSWGRNDERERDWFFGFRRDLSPLTKLTGRFDYDAINKKNTTESLVNSEFYYKARFDLYHRISPFTDISMDYIWMDRKAISNHYRSYVSNEVGFSLNHYFLNGLSARINPNYRHEYYPADGVTAGHEEDSRTKHIYTVTAGLNYRLSDWLNLGLGYTLDAIRAPLHFNDKYIRNTYSVELRGDF